MPKINKGERNKRGSGARMKREYVKPVIESEEFVANEYVASCWDVYCHGTLLGLGWFGHTNHNKVVGTVSHMMHEPTFDNGDSDNDGFSLNVHNLGGSTYNTNYWSGDGGHESVTVTPNPNASA